MIHNIQLTNLSNDDKVYLPLITNYIDRFGDIPEDTDPELLYVEFLEDSGIEDYWNVKLVVTYSEEEIAALAAQGRLFGDAPTLPKHPYTDMTTTFVCDCSGLIGYKEAMATFVVGAKEEEFNCIDFIAFDNEHLVEYQYIDINGVYYELSEVIYVEEYDDYMLISDRQIELENGIDYDRLSQIDETNYNQYCVGGFDDGDIIYSKNLNGLPPQNWVLTELTKEAANYPNCKFVVELCFGIIRLYKF